MLKLENISKYYYNSSNVTCALRKINLDFKIGEFVAITGESGSGKTTLLNLISGLDSYEDGEMYYHDKQTSYFDDEDWEKYRKEEIAFIFQHYNLIDSFTVLENVAVSYIIDGYKPKEAKAKAKEVLKLVGLNKDIHKKAIKLSGGQKQRLSIARALAKETNIIVADEPTGNLDAENGRIILELLKKLSKDKLVIVVTHNLAQIEPFITRKVRLHDGEIVLDEKISEIERKEDVQEKEIKKEKTFVKMMNFSFLNLKSQPKKTLLLMLLTIVSVISSFIFVSNFKMNLDDNKTKALDDKIFINFDETRMLARKTDSSIITDEILQEAYVDNVVSVEKYDYITDVNYYREGDYKIKYAGGFTEPDLNGNVSFIDSSSLLLVDHSHFMRSSYSLSLDDLSCGKLPTNELEMVVYSDDQSILDTEEIVLFRNARKWGEDTWYKYKVKIVGILKEATDQVYFSDYLCQMMELTQHTLSIQVHYAVKIGYYYRKRTLSFDKVVYDPNIGSYDLSFDIGRLNAISDARIDNANNTYMVNNKVGEWHSYKFNLENALTVTDNALGVSREVFDYIYQKYQDKKQFALFVSDYAYLDEVQDDLANIGFESLSCFKSSVTGYDTNKVINRYINLIVSVVALLIINLIIVLLGYAILKFKKNDYVIFKMIGMTNKLCIRINYVELLFYSLISNIVLIVLANIVKNNVTNALVVDMFRYVKVYDYLIVFVISVASMLILGNLFGKFLTNKAKITVLKEE
ncbi:MAG: ATP-binding cassette domain-containing protein [Bacilli bacterium]|nr:ATP-binding cassette domain-containing protein [Bacilli bacterium]